MWQKYYAIYHEENNKIITYFLLICLINGACSYAQNEGFLIN